MVVKVNWLTLCQECRRAVFWTRHYSSCTFWCIFYILKMRLSVMLITVLWRLFVPSPGVKVTVADSLILDLGRVSEWRDLWGTNFNASKTKTMIVSRSRTMHPQSPALTIGKNVLKESDDHVILEERDIRFQDDFWEESSLGHQGSFSKAWNLEELLASIPW